LGKAALAALVMSGAVWAFLEFAPLSSAILRGGIGVVTGGVVYAATWLLVGADEEKAVIRMVLR
jgi:hypothetical protein